VCAAAWETGTPSSPPDSAAISGSVSSEAAVAASRRAELPRRIARERYVWRKTTFLLVLFWRISGFSTVAFPPSCGCSLGVDGYGHSPSFKMLLQQPGVDSSFSFSGHSLCRWPHSHHKQRGCCLQFAQTWLNLLAVVTLG
jgi:hypothetical protein